MGTFDIAYCISPKKNYDSMNFANFGATTRETSMPRPGQIKAKKKNYGRLSFVCIKRR